MAGFAQITGNRMIVSFTGVYTGAVVATRARTGLSDYRAMVKQRHNPGSNRMTTAAIQGGGNMIGRFSAR